MCTPRTLSQRSRVQAEDLLPAWNAKIWRILPKVVNRGKTIPVEVKKIPPKMTILPLPAKLSRRDVPTVDIELGEVRLGRWHRRCSRTRRLKKKKKKKKEGEEEEEEEEEEAAKCISRTSNRKLYSYGSNEPLTTAGEFESELCYNDKHNSVSALLSWKIRKEQYSAGRP